MKDIIIYSIVIIFLFLINIYLLVLKKNDYIRLFFYYSVILTIFLVVGILINKKYNTNLKKIKDYNFELDEELQETTPKCPNQNFRHCRSVKYWNQSIIPYDLSQIGDTEIKRKDYLMLNIKIVYLIVSIIIIGLLFFIIYLIYDIYNIYNNTKKNIKIKE